ncbi:MAG: major facilitator superfamily domain-containing protein 1 [bacterium]|nr:major facilitator superfamily domain-containing protein 1 [bacterium]
MTDIKNENTKTIVRWSLLLLVSFVIAANYYSYDAMSAIKETMQTQLGLSSTQYGIIVSFYSFPNTFLLMTVFGGIFLDRFGIRKTGFLFTLFCALGVLLTAYGASDMFRGGGFGYSFFKSVLPQYSPELKVMILGRLLFGLGAETSIVVINKVIVKWFKGKELGFAFGVNLAIARFGTVAALILSPRLIESQGGWTTALWVASMLMGLGLLVFIVYMIYDKKHSSSEKTGSLLDADERFNFGDITALLKNKSFLYISFLCVTFYSAVFPFLSYCPDFLHNKFGFSLKSSGDLSSVIIWGTIVFTPLFGLLADLKGKRATLMFYGSGMLLVAHLTLSLTSLTPYIAMFVIGIAFSLVPAAMWPGVARLVDEKRLGTAYGIMTSIQNLGLFAFPILAGWLTDKMNPGVTNEMLKAGTATLDYTYTILMFACLGLVGFALAFLLKRADDQSPEHRLERPEIAK